MIVKQLNYSTKRWKSIFWSQTTLLCWPILMSINPMNQLVWRPKYDSYMTLFESFLDSACVKRVQLVTHFHFHRDISYCKQVNTEKCNIYALQFIWKKGNKMSYFTSYWFWFHPYLNGCTTVLLLRNVSETKQTFSKIFNIFFVVVST